MRRKATKIMEYLIITANTEEAKTAFAQRANAHAMGATPSGKHLVWCVNVVSTEDHEFVDNLSAVQGVLVTSVSLPE